MPIDTAAPATREKTKWRIELLGRFCARPVPETPDGELAEPVEQFRTHKAALLLARLALFPQRAHAREELADLLWPDAPYDRGRASLSQTLAYLRAALHQPRTDGLIIADHKTVRLAKGVVQTDVAEWEAAACQALVALEKPWEQAALVQAAMAAYHGELMPGFYDDWVCDERSRLEALLGQLRTCLPLLEAASSPVSVARDPVSRPMPASVEDVSGPSLVNAPLLLTRFFGRETERARIGGLLQQQPPVRLVTLLGMGGIGKTRIAVEIAQEVVSTAQPVFGWAAFVPLDQARTADQMEGILLSVLGVQSQDGDGFAAAVRYLNARGAVRAGDAGSGRPRLLLVLDNLEQLGDAAAPFVASLLSQVPGLTVLATSRQPVGIAGEQEIPLGPLADKSGVVTEMAEDARLFVDRACLARASFALTPENREVVVRLCAVLEGVPLALELAAAWIRVLTPGQIVGRLNNRFDVLALRGASGVSVGVGSKRHHSLHAAIAWSYDLLGPALQTFWAQLSVFRGGWTADAAQAVTGIADVSEPLLLLTERSLILAEADGATGEMRYRMLESLREFASEQAEAQGSDFCRAREARHAGHFAFVAREAYAMTRDGRGMRSALGLLGPERDNLRVIFTRLQEVVGLAAADGGDDPTRFIASAVECSVQSAWLWPGSETRLSLQLAVEALALLPAETSHALRASVLAMQGRHISLGGNYVTAERLLHESLALWQALGNEKEVITVKGYLAVLAWHTGDTAGAFAGWMEGLGFAQRTGNLRLESAMLSNLSIVGPDLAQRRAWVERAVDLDRKHWPASTFLAASLSCLGTVAREQNDLATVRACYEEACEVAVADGSRGMIGVAKSGLAGFLYEQGEALAHAEQLLCEAQALYEELEEYPRIVFVLLLRFQVAVKRGDADAALGPAGDYLRVNRAASLLDDAGLVAARADLVRQLQGAGFAAHAVQFEKAVGA